MAEPVALNRCTISLLGPVGSGKSSLLQTFVDCIEQSAHGYDLNRRIRVKDIEASDFETGVPAGPRILANENGDYQILKKQFFRQTTATEQTLDYYFRLEAAGDRDPSPILLRVVDSAGEFAIREGDARIERAEEQIQKLREALEQSDAVIFALPLTNMGNVGWQGSLQRVIAELSHPDLKNPSRVVVAFTHYERLFVNLGQSAFEFACSSAIARNVILQALTQSTWSESLDQLYQRGAEVYFTVTSAYGFVKGYGNPNIDPHQLDDEIPFGRNGVAASMTRFWRPFLTAEPFICAALNEPSEFAFRLADIRKVRPVPTVDEAGPGIWRSGWEKVGRLADWFNRNSSR